VDPPREARDERRTRRARDEQPARRKRGDMLRAFFAIDLDGAVRRRAERELSRLSALPGADAVRWVRPEALHVTLRFLGEIAAASVPELLARVASRTREVPAFELVLGGVGALPSARRARVVTLEAGPEEPLQRLASAVEQGVVEAGFAPERRRFRPHVTLGRVRRDRRLGGDIQRAMTASDTPGSEAFAVTRVLLYRSEPTPGGSTYTSIGHVQLQ
jgi:2'-5' RNA ligase